MLFFASALKGNEKLWKVTWLGYLGGVLVLALFAVLSVGIIGEASGFVFVPLVALYNVWGLVSMWRCAANVGWRGWFYLTRVVVALTAIMWMLEIVGVLPE